MDPIEKKPLYHWRPGSLIASAGFAGCNLHCPFCQNWHISQIPDAAKTNAGGVDLPYDLLSPKELIAAVKSAYSQNAMNEQGSMQIAYTYSEPLIHAEFLIECMREAKSLGIANVIVTNGCINKEPAGTVLSLCDAANIDLKCFSEKTYQEVLGGHLHSVLGFIRIAVTTGVHTEVTTLVVPGLNDGEAELAACAEFIAALNKDIPWHLSAYHPDWKWKAPPTDPAKLTAAAERARHILNYVYTGNISGGQSDTLCLHCGKPLVQRSGYRITTAMNNGNCASCGKPSPIRIH
jgi:pyruvate formate lyase activating enzyme